MYFLVIRILEGSRKAPKCNGGPGAAPKKRVAEKKKKRQKTSTVT